MLTLFTAGIAGLFAMGEPLTRESGARQRPAERASRGTKNPDEESRSRLWWVLETDLLGRKIGIPSKRVTGAIFGARRSRGGEQAVKARSTLTTILAIWSAESGRAGAGVAIYLE